MLRHTTLFLFAAAVLAAQPTIAPTPQQAGRPRGEDTGNYNIVNSFETGYRFRQVDGDIGKYRSDVNFGNGIRLLGSNLTINSKDGRGRFFDEILLNTLGLGNDPYQFSSLRVQKNGLYRYESLWRLNEYFNPALPVAFGWHRQNTRRQLQDHSLVLLPQSRFKFFLGYTRNSQSGPALSTIQLFDQRGDIYPFFADVRRKQDEYRVGGEIQAFGMKLHVIRGWEYFKEDTPYLLQNPEQGFDLTDRNRLDQYRRAEPYHGSTPNWRINLFRDANRWIGINGRFTHASGRRNFIQDESAFGTDRFGALRNRQILIFGTGRRPVTTGSLTLNVFPATRLTLTNHTALHNVRMEGDNSYREVNNLSLGALILNFQYLGIRTFVNTTDANLQVTKWLGLTGGYHFSTRRIRSIEREDFGAGTIDARRGEQENQLHAGRAGVRIRPGRGLTVLLDGEVGRTNRPFYPTSERNYEVFGGRMQYKQKSVFLSAAVRTNYNINSVSLASYSSRARNYFLDASWTPSNWFAIDAGYSKIHLNTAGTINYFVAFDLVEGERSLYISNVHTGHLGARFNLRRRVDLFAGFSRVQDTGDGRANPLGARGGASLPIFQAAQTFPLAFTSPSGRISVRLRNQLRWNFGYQYYGYREDFFFPQTARSDFRQNYRANTGFTSLTWSF